MILKLRCLCCFFSIMGTNLTFSAMSEGSWMKSRSCFFSFFLYTSQNPGCLLRTSDVITLQMQISFNHPAIVSFLFISQSFSLRKPTGAHSALLAVITGDRKRRGEFKGAAFSRCEIIPVHALSATGKGGHMGRTPLQCNIQRDLT